MSKHIDNESFLNQLLVGSKYGAVRHVIILFALAAVSLSANTYAFLSNKDVLGKWIYLPSLITLIGYFSVVYLHIYLLVPRFLFRKKYLRYIFLSSILIFLLVCLKPLMEYYFNELLNLAQRRAGYLDTTSILDIISDFVLNMICITGGCMMILLEKWNSERKRINSLQQKQLTSEIDTMKDQINPDFMLHSLNRIGNLAKSDKEKAAEMILKLSQLLRYQLYDGSQDKVLLSSEISFLKNYILLEQFYNDFFDFQIDIQTDVSRVFIKPLIFVPFVQKILEKLLTETAKPKVNIKFHTDSEAVTFQILFTDNNMNHKIDLQKISYRLEHIYQDNFNLSEFFTGNDRAIRLVIKTKAYDESNR